MSTINSHKVFIRHKSGLISKRLSDKPNCDNYLSKQTPNISKAYSQNTKLGKFNYSTVENDSTTNYSSRSK